MIDMHIHLMEAAEPDPGCLLKSMHNSGITEGFIISPPPASFTRTDPDAPQNKFANRLDMILQWCNGGDLPADRKLSSRLDLPADRETSSRLLHPIMWIDPHEPEADKQIQQAQDHGIAGFKIICTQAPPEHPAVIKAAEQIAELNRPIIFHSGILWDGHNSSQYNRPAGFEALIRIPKLRFSMAHASWPWIDECLAVYGKFNQLKNTQPNVSSELFIDLTPGTPKIYREELIRKLLTIGYPLEDNILFGTDNMANNYNTTWAQDWLQTDHQLIEKYQTEKTEQLWQKYTTLNAHRFLYG
jgi:predicted TIM-barrel fold metal-dependent hydrolase